MDLLIEKNDGSKAFISQFKVLVTEFEESAPVVKRNNTELDQRNGAIDFGGWHDSKEIKLTAIYKADGMDDEERLREKIYALLSDPDGYYITQFKTSPLEALQRPGETTGDYFEQLNDYPSHKRFNVYASEIENEFQGRIGDELLYKLAVTFKTLWLPYGETPARDVVLNENKVSAVGTNLYTNTKDVNNPNVWYAYGSWVKEADKYNGLTVIHNTGDWNGISQYIPVKKGETYTISMYAKYVSGTGDSYIFWALNNDSEGNYNTAVTTPADSLVGITDKWVRISATTTVTSDGYLRPRIERSTNNTNTLQIAGIKVEKGSVATDRCPNPADANYNSWLYDINSVAIKYIGTVPCNQLEQGFKIRFTAAQEADHLDLSMNGETITYSDTVYSGDVFEFAGFSYKLNKLSVTNKVTKSYYTLQPNGENILSCNITGKFEIIKFQNLYA